jgi:hypothetical protein
MPSYLSSPIGGLVPSAIQAQSGSQETPSPLTPQRRVSHLGVAKTIRLRTQRRDRMDLACSNQTSEAWPPLGLSGSGQEHHGARGFPQSETPATRNGRCCNRVERGATLANRRSRIDPDIRYSQRIRFRRTWPHRAEAEYTARLLRRI